MMNRLHHRALLNFTFSIIFILSICNLEAQENALHFDGTDDFAGVANASSTIVGGTGISMSCWVYPMNNNSGWPNFDGMCGFRNESSADFYLLQLNSTNLEARFRNSSGTVYTITYTGLQLNTWQHYVLTYDGSNLKLYKDNTMVSSIAASGSISSSVETFYMGKIPYQNSSFQFLGTIDEVCLYNKALSTTEISALYTCGTQLAPSNLKLHFQFNQGTAGGNNSGLTTATNSAGSQNATLANFALSGSTSNWVAGMPIGNFNYISNSICQGDSMLFAGQYLNSAGTYSDTISISGSCDSIVILTLNVQQGFYDTTYTSICTGDTISFHGMNYFQSGVYSQSYASAQCDSIYTLHLTVNPIPSPFIISGPSNVIENQIETYTAPSNTNLTYSWFVSGGAILNQPSNNTIEVQWGTPGNGVIKAIATNQNACVSDTVGLTFIIGIDAINGVSDFNIKVYPNPVQSTLHLDYNQAFTAYIYDVNSKLVKTFHTLSVDLSDLSSGTYLLTIVTKKGDSISKQIVVE